MGGASSAENFRTAAAAHDLEAMERIYKDDPTVLLESTTDPSGNDWLMYSLDSKQPDSSKFLNAAVEKFGGVDLRRQNKFGETPVHWAVAKNRIESLKVFLRLIREEMRSNSEDGGARGRQQSHTIDVLDITERRNGYTPLHTAAHFGAVEAFNLMCDVDDGGLRTKSSNGQTPLGVAQEKTSGGDSSRSAMCMAVMKRLGKNAETHDEQFE